ncbi:hypothetical protein DZF97_14215, partial [Clavibacter nebraskensis]
MTAIEVRALAASEVGRLEQEEPPGRGFARAMWAAQAAGGSTLLVAWDGDRRHRDRPALARGTLRGL